MIQVIKRQRWTPPGEISEYTYESINIIKIINRIKYLAVGHDGLGGEDVDPKCNYKSGREIIRIGRPLNKIKIQELALEVIKMVTQSIKTSDIDKFTIKRCLERNLESLEYEELATRIFVSAMHKETPCRLADSMKYAFFTTTPSGEHTPRIREEILLFVMQYEAELEHMIDYCRDFNIGYFGQITLARPDGVAYLNKDSARNLVERPQHLFMREALEFHADMNGDKKIVLDRIRTSYNILSRKYATHATPTMTNCCSQVPKLVSCNLMCMRDDSIPGIGESLSDMMMLSKNEAGVGVYVSNVRSSGTIIKSTGGLSRGLKPLFKVFEKIFEYIDQGGKRKGSAAFYIDVWHADFLEIIKMPRNTQGADEDRARSLFYAAIVNDVFMRAAEYECTGECPGISCPGMHFFMSPDACPTLVDTWGDAYESHYRDYVMGGKYISMMHAREIMYEIIFSMINSGKLYVFNRDAANRSNNLSNVGMINCSNLCTEICLPVRYISKEDKTDIISVCNLASIKLDSFIIPANESSYSTNGVSFQIDYLRILGYDFDGNELISYFDIRMFERTIKTITRNLDLVIDKTYYPENKTRETNLTMRPIGLGVQGMADLFIKLGLPYESNKARTLNWLIFNWIYLFALEETVLMAGEKGAYSYFEGSPASLGVLQFDTWPNSYAPDEVDINELLTHQKINKEFINVDNRFARLRGRPMRNSMLLAPMPTASTAQILDSFESFEPITNNLFTRTTLAGQKQIVNRHLMAEMESRGQWNDEVVKQLILDNGSVRNLNIPNHAKQIYKTVYEISMKRYIDMAADRGQFICHSQSMNLYWTGEADEIKNKIYTALMYGWKLGLKTLSYYTRIQTQTGQKIGTETKKKEEGLQPHSYEGPLSIEEFRRIKEASKQAALTGVGDCEMCQG